VLLPRTGSTFSSSPSLTISQPTGASSFFPMDAAMSADGATLAIGDSGVAGGGGVFVYTGGTTTPVQTLAPIAGEQDFGSSVSVRSDGEELVEGSIQGTAQVGVFRRGATGYTRVQSVPPPAGATGDFSVSVSLASDGTLVATDYGAHIYIYAP
jgi:hypothetical protein